MDSRKTKSIWESISGWWSGPKESQQLAIGKKEFPSTDNVINAKLDPKTDYSDALARLETELYNFQSRLNVEIDLWEKEQIRILGETKYVRDAHTLPEKQDDWFAKLREIFAAIKAKMIGLIDSPHHVLEEMEKQITAHINEMMTHLIAQRDALHAENDKNSDKANILKDDICATGIHILNELLLLTDNVLAELKQAVINKEFKREVANQLVNVILNALIKFPLPKVDFYPTLRNDLYQEVAPDKVVIEDTMIQAEGALQGAFNELESVASHLAQVGLHSPKPSRPVNQESADLPFARSASV